MAVLAACFILNMFGRGLADTYTVFLLPLEREFGWTRSELTGVYSIYLLVNGLSAPLVGLLFLVINTILFLLLRRAPKGVDV